MPQYTVRLSTSTGVDANMVSALKVNIANQLHPRYSATSGTVAGNDGRSFPYTVDSVDHPNELVYVSVDTQRR